MRRDRRREPRCAGGTEHELAVLTETLRRVRRGGQIVVIEGEAGIGKSRLLEAGLESARAAGAEALLERLEQRSMRSSVVVAIEDLHWADGATLGVVAQIARGVEALPVALILTTRPQPRRRELERLLAVLESLGAPAIALGPLDPDACRQLVADL